MKWLWMAAFLLGCTAVPFVIVLANSGWRRAVEAWRHFAGFLGAGLALGGCTWVAWYFMPPLP